MYEFVRTRYFADWFDSITDAKAKDRINWRIQLAMNGNFGDCEPVGEGVSEMRLHFGPGYRLYFYQRGKQVFLLLTGGTKRHQQGDIDRAKGIKMELERGGLW
jgi:putative addiction module killer protein